MPKRWGRRLRTALLAGTCAATPLSARADDAWLGQEVDRLAAVPHTLQAVQAAHWLQVPVAQQAGHAVGPEAYRQVRPRLDALAAQARPALERELGAILAGLTFEALQATARLQKLWYCDWIGTTRPDGLAPSTSDLQAVLLARCWAVAGPAIQRLLLRRADAIDLALPALPGAELGFPRWVLGDLAAPDATGKGALDPLASQQSYQARLAQRIAAATPALRQQLEDHYAARRWPDTPLAAPASGCRAMLGPLAAGALLDHCMAVAEQWLVAVQPAVSAALPGALSGLLADGQLASEATLCRHLLGRWLPGEGYPGAFQATLRADCAAAAQHAVSQAVTVHARQLAAGFLMSPASYDSLLAHGWFGQPAARWDGLVAAAGPDAAALRARVQAAYADQVMLVGEAAMRDAMDRIGRAYAAAAGSVAAVPATQRLCGTDGRGDSLPAAAQGGEGFHDRVVAACRVAHDAFGATRVAAALDRAGLRADDQRAVVMDTGGADARVPLRTLIMAAARAGLQLRIRTGLLGRQPTLVVTPMGADTPALVGTLLPEGGNLRLIALDALPGWAADPADTVACFTASQEDLAGAQLGAVLAMFGGWFALEADRPRTASHSFRVGFARLQQAGDLRACLAARQAFLGQVPAP